MMADVELRKLGSYICEGRVDKAKRVEFDAALQQLVDVARTSDGREELASANAVPALLSSVSCVFPKDLGDPSWSFKSFHLYVKLLRNLCAGNPVNQEALLEGVEALARVLELLAPLYSSPHGTCEDVPVEGLQIVLQLLGNVAGLGEVSQARIWARFFPSVFHSVAQVANPKVQEPLCMVIYACCRENYSRCSQLAEATGASVVASLLNKGGGDVAPSNEWLEFLISHLCFANPSFPALFTSLGGTGWSIAETKGFTEEQACLLDVMNARLSAREEESHIGDPSAEESHCTSASFLVDIIRAASKYAASTTVPTRSPASDVLGLSLSITRILCVLDATRATILPKFAACGLIPLLLTLLRALGPADSAKPGTTSTQDSDEQPSPSQGFPKRDVYPGYRRDVVAVIANASYRSCLVQELVRENGGLLVVLQQCMPDSNNPFLREWGLWAIRNLLEGNSANQAELADLEIKSTVPDARLRDAGLSVEINPDTGRPRLVNVASATDNPAVDEFM